MLSSALASLVVLAVANPVFPADAPSAGGQLEQQPAAAPAPPPTPAYLLPWSLRGAAASSGLRVDDVFASSSKTTSDVLFVSGSYAVTKHLGLALRIGAVGNWPGAGAAGFTFVNPALGATYGVAFGDFKLAGYLGCVLPLGTGGGDAPDAAVAAADKSGAPARAAMDNAMFAVNDLTFIPGVDLAWVHGGATVQLEATVLQLTRVRGALVEKDAARTNFTTGLFAGYQFVPALSAGAELRYQRWLSTPSFVEVDPGLRDNLSAALGLRTRFELGGHVVRPGLSYGRGLAGDLSAKSYQFVQLDLPMAF